MTQDGAVQFTRMVRKIRLFSDMQMALLEKILAWVCLYRCEKGEKICRQGELGDSFFVVSTGSVSVSVKKGLFFSTQVAVLRSGDCFGEMSLLGRAPRNATVTCEEESRVFVLLSENFNDILKSNPAFAEEIKKLARQREFEDGKL